VTYLSAGTQTEDEGLAGVVTHMHLGRFDVVSYSIRVNVRRCLQADRLLIPVRKPGKSHACSKLHLCMVLVISAGKPGRSHMYPKLHMVSVILARKPSVSHM